MSVLIRGMKMPDKCGHCRFATAFECEVTKNFITTFNVRQADCPLVPVQPHGRLADADVLSKMFDPDESFGAAVLEIVEDAPTVIQAEEGET